MADLIERILLAFPDEIADGDLIKDEQTIWFESQTANRVVALLRALREYRVAVDALDAAGVDPYDLDRSSPDELLALRQALRDVEFQILKIYDAKI